MNDSDNLRDETISDFGDQWARYTDSEGWYGSIELFKDITRPLLDVESLNGTYVAEIGSGAGRIVGMLLNAGVKHVYAIEPSSDAFEVLGKNVKQMQRSSDVTIINTRGDNWRTDHELDYVFAIGVIHHIPEPGPVLNNAYEALKPGGYILVWLYGHEGNERYLKFIEPLRLITTRLPHLGLRIIVELLYYLLLTYKFIGKILPLPLRSYIDIVLWPMTPQKRRLVIYDQLNPAYAKYYKKEEAMQLLRNAGFANIQIHHRHGYSWSVLGQKSIAQPETPVVG